jgi:hypothetical protein
MLKQRIIKTGLKRLRLSQLATPVAARNFLWTQA